MNTTGTTAHDPGHDLDKLLRIIRLDDADSKIYRPAAAAGEWAVTGSFYFWDVDSEALRGAQKQAFAHGFLGTESFGWGSLVAVAEINPMALELTARRLAAHLVERFGAPDLQTALPAAREEVAYACGLCEHPVNTLLAVSRDLRSNGINESFKLIRPPGGVDHATLSFWGPES